MPDPETLHHSLLIFPSAHSAINTTLTAIKKSNLTISNRLKSILSDADFVQRVASTYQNLPIIANERCGSWYVPPSQKAGSAYFKSTDGHYGEWGFNLRRLNLQVLEVIGEDGGCIIVDSTRRGKSMPDALSKTIPIWIAVINRLLFPDDDEASHLRTPEDVVSRSEHAQIQERLPDFVSHLQRLRIDIESYREMLKGKPLQPVWTTPDTCLPITPPDWDGRNRVVLCTASGRTSESESGSSDYVQGAADDSESWARGLDATTFWTNSEQLLATSEDDLPAVIDSLVEASRQSPKACRLVLIKPTNNIWIGSNAAAELDDADFTVIISCSEKPNDTLAAKLNRRYVHLPCTTGKVGSRRLRHELPKLNRTTRVLTNKSRVLVTCQTGKDLAVGVALAIICHRYGEDGRLFSVGLETDPPAVLNKAVIKHRLSWIMLSMPDASPSRATLQSINAFLLG